MSSGSCPSSFCSSSVRGSEELQARRRTALRALRQLPGIRAHHLITPSGSLQVRTGNNMYIAHQASEKHIFILKITTTNQTVSNLSLILFRISLKIKINKNNFTFNLKNLISNSHFNLRHAVAPFSTKK
jgi:hypothetical protein